MASKFKAYFWRICLLFSFHRLKIIILTHIDTILAFYVYGIITSVSFSTHLQSAFEQLDQFSSHMVLTSHRSRLCNMHIYIYTISYVQNISTYNFSRTSLLVPNIETRMTIRYLFEQPESYWTLNVSLFIHVTLNLVP
jgi:hypothetical protein